MTNKGTAKPYVKCIGDSATGVTQSCYLVRFQKYCLLLDCGLYQESDIATNYKENIKLLKKIHPTEVDWIILSHSHIDHIGLVPALYARGCQAHILIPTGSKIFLKLLWEDSMKIFQQDCQKLNHKGTKVSPYYTQEDIDRALDRCIEVKDGSPYQLTPNITMTYYPANHIVYACQVHLEFYQDHVYHRLNFTGDIGGLTSQPYVKQRQTLPYANITLAENTYNDSKKRINKQYDRPKDLEKIEAVVRDYRKVLIPCFSLGRTQTILTELYNMDLDGKIPNDVYIIIDSPLAQKFCDVWPEEDLWPDIMKWSRLHFTTDWTESQTLMKRNSHDIIISASGFLNGGRVMEWLKFVLPNSNNAILFCGYSGENNLAYQIRHGDSVVNVDGEIVENKANIIELVSFSSHASYQELMDYYANELRYDKILLVHGNMDNKVNFANVLQNKLIEQGKSSRVVAANMDTKIFF